MLNSEYKLCILDCGIQNRHFGIFKIIRMQEEMNGGCREKSPIRFRKIYSPDQKANRHDVGFEQKYKIGTQKQNPI